MKRSLVLAVLFFIIGCGGSVDVPPTVFYDVAPATGSSGEGGADSATSVASSSSGSSTGDGGAATASSGTGTGGACPAPTCPGIGDPATLNCDPSCGAVADLCVASCGVLALPWGHTVLKAPAVQQQAGDCQLGAGAPLWFEWLELPNDAPFEFAVDGPPNSIAVRESDAGAPDVMTVEPDDQCAHGLTIPSKHVFILIAIRQPSAGAVFSIDVEPEGQYPAVSALCDGGCSGDAS